MRLLAVLLAAVVSTGATVVAREREGVSPSRAGASARPAEGEGLPAPGAALPRTPGALGAAVGATTRRLRVAIGRWNATGAVPRDVTLLALYQQRMLRLMTARRSLGDATLARLPGDVRADARATVLARRDLAAIPRATGRLPRVRVAKAAPAADLRSYYRAAQRRFGIDWSVLAAINFVESAFGRIRSASEAGARGPMQFLPATWRRYGMGGDIDSPRDAILGAAYYLHRAGASVSLDRALFAYNHSTRYVRAIRRFAGRIRVDDRTFLSYYAWQVFVRTPAGVRRLTGPGRGGKRHQPALQTRSGLACDRRRARCPRSQPPRGRDRRVSTPTTGCRYEARAQNVALSRALASQCTEPVGDHTNGPREEAMQSRAFPHSRLRVAFGSERLAA